MNKEKIPYLVENEERDTFTFYIKGTKPYLELQQRIDKAIEYIKEHSEMTNLQIYGIENVLAFRGSLKELLEILGDKE